MIDKLLWGNGKPNNNFEVGLTYSNPRPYEQRKNSRSFMVLSDRDDIRERESIAELHHCTFDSVNRSDLDTRFSLIERDDKKGYELYMKNVKVIPNDALHMVDAPSWFVWIGSILQKLRNHRTRK